MKILKTYILPPVFVALLVAIDQFTKYLAVTHLKPIREFPLIDGVFSLRFTTNDGMAFGMLSGARWFFVVFTVLLMAFGIYFYATMPKTRRRGVLRFFLLMFMGGALGNFIDRLLNGYVVDFFFFSLINFPIFNVADIFLVVAAIAMCAIAIFTREPKNG